MSNTGATPKREQREKARETARLAREREKQRKRRNRILIQSGIGVVILAVVAVVIVVISSTSHSPAAVAAGHSPKNMAAGGIVLEGSSGGINAVTAPASASSRTPTPAGTLKSSSPVHVVTYIDWSCPVCKQFEGEFSSQLKSLVASGKITLEIHPVAILDRSYQSSRYSSRAANAAACVANFEPSEFLAAQTEFYDKQPAEGSTGLTNAQILSLLKTSGADTPSVTACVNQESFKSWVTSTTTRTVNEASLADPTQGGFGTPTVFVNGKRWSGTTNLISDITAAEK